MPSIETLAKYRHMTFLGLSTVIALLWTMLLNHAEFSGSEKGVFIIYVLGFLLLQLTAVGVLYFLGRFAKVFTWLSYGAAIGFTSYNLFTMIIVHNSRFGGLEGVKFAAMIAVITAVVGAAYIIRNKNFIKFMHVFSGIMIFFIVVQFVNSGFKSLEGLWDRMPPFIKMVDFKEKPNIYLISFDALIPEAVAKDVIGVKNVPYIEAIKREGLRFVPNTFAENIPTRRSLNLALALDKEHYNTVSESAGFIRDQVPNPVYEILRHNGYKIQFMYKTSYFGDAGRKLDFYGVADVQGLCQHVEKKYGFMGYCLDDVQKEAKKWNRIQPVSYFEMLHERVRIAGQSAEPWFTYTYIYAPGHAKLTIDYRKEKDRVDYREYFTKNSLKVVTPLVELLQAIKENDPDSITIVFGDHGAMVSKGIFGQTGGIDGDALIYSADDADTSYPLSYEQAVQDRHGVINAIMPADVCTEQFNHNPYSSTRIMRDVFICLSGEDPMPSDYQPNDDRWAPFIYE